MRARDKQHQSECSRVASMAVGVCAVKAGEIPRHHTGWRVSHSSLGFSVSFRDNCRRGGGLRSSCHSCGARCHPKQQMTNICAVMSSRMTRVGVAPGCGPTGAADPPYLLLPYLLPDRGGGTLAPPGLCGAPLGEAGISQTGS